MWLFFLAATVAAVRFRHELDALDEDAPLGGVISGEDVMHQSNSFFASLLPDCDTNEKVCHSVADMCEYAATWCDHKGEPDKIRKRLYNPVCVKKWAHYEHDCALKNGIALDVDQKPLLNGADAAGYESCLLLAKSYLLREYGNLSLKLDYGLDVDFWDFVNLAEPRWDGPFEPKKEMEERNNYVVDNADWAMLERCTQGGREVTMNQAIMTAAWQCMAYDSTMSSTCTCGQNTNSNNCKVIDFAVFNQSETCFKGCMKDKLIMQWDEGMVDAYLEGGMDSVFENTEEASKYGVDAERTSDWEVLDAEIECNESQFKDCHNDYDIIRNDAESAKLRNDEALANYHQRLSEEERLKQEALRKQKEAALKAEQAAKEAAESEALAKAAAEDAAKAKALADGLDAEAAAHKAAANIPIPEVDVNPEMHPLPVMPAGPAPLATDPDWHPPAVAGTQPSVPFGEGEDEAAPPVVAAAPIVVAPPATPAQKGGLVGGAPAKPTLFQKKTRGHVMSRLLLNKMTEEPSTSQEVVEWMVSPDELKSSRLGKTKSLVGNFNSPDMLNETPVMDTVPAAGMAVGVPIAPVNTPQNMPEHAYNPNIHHELMAKEAKEDEEYFKDLASGEVQFKDDADELRAEEEPADACPPDVEEGTDCMFDKDGNWAHTSVFDLPFNETCMKEVDDMFTYEDSCGGKWTYDPTTHSNSFTAPDGSAWNFEFYTEIQPCGEPPVDALGKFTTTAADGTVTEECLPAAAVPPEAMVPVVADPAAPPAPQVVIHNAPEIVVGTPPATAPAAPEEGAAAPPADAAAAPPADAAAAPPADAAAAPPADAAAAAPPADAAAAAPPADAAAAAPPADAAAAPPAFLSVLRHRGMKKMLKRDVFASRKHLKKSSRRMLSLLQLVQKPHFRMKNRQHVAVGQHAKLPGADTVGVPGAEYDNSPIFPGIDPPTKWEETDGPDIATQKNLTNQQNPGNSVRLNYRDLPKGTIIGQAEARPDMPAPIDMGGAFKPPQNPNTSEAWTSPPLELAPGGTAQKAYQKIGMETVSDDSYYIGEPAYEEDPFGGWKDEDDFVQPEICPAKGAMAGEKLDEEGRKQLAAFYHAAGGPSMSGPPMCDIIKTGTKCGCTPEFLIVDEHQPRLR